MEYVHKCTTTMAIYGCKETKPNQREILAALCWLILIFFVITNKNNCPLSLYYILHLVFQGGGKKQRKHQQSGCALISPPSDCGG